MFHFRSESIADNIRWQRSSASEILHNIEGIIFLSNRIDINFKIIRSLIYIRDCNRARWGKNSRLFSTFFSRIIRHFANYSWNSHKRWNRFVTIHLKIKFKSRIISRLVSQFNTNFVLFQYLSLIQRHDDSQNYHHLVANELSPMIICL